MRDNQQVQPVVADDFSKVTFNIADGKPALVLDMGKLHADIIRRAAAVGMAQVRIVDAAAVSREREDGSIKSKAEMMAEKRERMSALIEHYESGTAEWSRVGTGGGGKSITVEAIAALKGVDYETAEADVATFAEKKYGGDTKKALAFLRQGARVAAKIEEIRKSRMAAPKVDADEALDELTA